MNCLQIMGVSLILFLTISCNSKVKEETDTFAKMYDLAQTDSIIESEVKLVRNFRLNSQNRRDALDSLMHKYPTIAYFYQ